jgi:serine protease Do
MLHKDVGVRTLSAIALVALFAACSQQSSTAIAANATASTGARAVPVSAAVPSAEAVAAANRGLPDFADLVGAVGPAVVNVTVIERSGRNQTTADPFGDSSGGGDDNSDDPLSDFFRRFGIPRGNAPPQNSAPSRGVGSGFIISPDGYILTNTHVVQNASKITVRLTDRREFDAKVIGTDERTDVAVIKINAKGDLPMVKLGDSDKLRPGQWVLAIGSPFTFENSVTAGVVSGTARTVGDGYVPFIQTDVAVNPGNSGGPLFNLNGEVVGINSQIFSNTGSFAGISFAIPIDVAIGVKDQLIKTGHVVRGRIGVSVQPVTAALAENFGLDRPRGAVVASVEPGSPAEKAGIEAQDVILAVNGKQIDQRDELPAMISAIRPGQTAQLDIWRDKGIKHITVTVDELKEKRTAAINPGDNGADQGGSGAVVNVPRIGLSVRPLSATEKSQAQTRGSVVITRSTGAAAEAGIQAGDVVLAVNRQRVNTVADFQNAVRSSGSTAALLLQRDDQQVILTVELR